MPWFLYLCHKQTNNSAGCLLGNASRKKESTEQCLWCSEVRPSARPQQPGGDRGLVGSWDGRSRGFRNGGFVSRSHRIYIHEGGTQRQSLIEFSLYEIGFPSRSYVAWALAYDNTHAGKKAKILLKTWQEKIKLAFDPLTIEGNILPQVAVQCGLSSSSKSTRTTAAS